jgi:hypothetical protein
VSLFAYFSEQGGSYLKSTPATCYVSRPKEERLPSKSTFSALIQQSCFPSRTRTCVPWYSYGCWLLYSYMPCRATCRVLPPERLFLDGSLLRGSFWRLLQIRSARSARSALRPDKSPGAEPCYRCSASRLGRWEAAGRDTRECTAHSTVVFGASPLHRTRAPTPVGALGLPVSSGGSRRGRYNSGTKAGPTGTISPPTQQKAN